MFDCDTNNFLKFYDIPLCDSHVHIFNFSNELRDLFNGLPASKYIFTNSSLDGFNKLIENYSIEYCFAFSLPVSIAPIHLLNSYILAKSFEYNWMLPVLIMPESIDDIPIDYFYGFKEHFYLHDSSNLYAYKEHYYYLEQTRKILLIHAEQSCIVRKIKWILENFPKLKVIIAHSGRRNIYTGKGIIENILPTLAKYENLFFDTSTIRDANIISLMVNIIGDERILFGSDYPFKANKTENCYQEEMNTILKANISKESIKRIFYRNFCNLVKEIKICDDRVKSCYNKK